MSQANAIRNKLIHERLVNNFENRTEFINLSRSVFANLLAIVEIESNKGTRLGNLNVDMLSNTTDTNDITTTLSDSTYQFSIHRHLKPSPFSSSLWTNNYDKIPSFSTLPADAEECNKRNNAQQQQQQHLPLAVQNNTPHASPGYIQIKMNKGAVKREKKVRRNNRVFSACKHCLIALSIVAVVMLIGFLLLKFWLKLF